MAFTFDEYCPESEFIRTVWRTRSGQAASFLSGAESHWEFVLTRRQGEATLTLKGPEAKARLAPVPSDAEFIGIQLHHGCYIPRFPVSAFTNTGVNLDAASAGRFWLKGSVLEPPSFEDADVFIDRLVRAGELVKDDLVPTVLDTRPVEVSPRTVQRRFLSVTGLSAKALQQIERARHAVTLLEAGHSVADVAFRAGYADQPHLTRSLKTFTGKTPAQFRGSAD